MSKYIIKKFKGKRKDYEKSQFNRVTSSKRQVGSTIKPFLYYTALENGFTPSSLFLSTNTSFNIGNELYSPSNFADIYPDKKIPMILALAYSDNIYALKTNMFLGDKSHFIQDSGLIPSPIIKPRYIPT